MKKQGADAAAAIDLLLLVDSFLGLRDLAALRSAQEASGVQQGAPSGPLERKERARKRSQSKVFASGERTK